MSRSGTTVTQDDLIAQLRRVAPNGRPPTVSEFDAHPETVSGRTLLREFDSFAGALHAAGLVPASGRLRQDQRQLLRCYAVEIHPWPDSEPFGTAKYVRDETDLPHLDISTDLTRRLLEASIIRVADNAGPPGDSINAYESVRGRPGVVVAQTLSEREQETMIPGCLHSGLKNLRDGGYTCGREDCDVEVSREEVRL